MKKIYFSIGLLVFTIAKTQKFKEITPTPLKNFYYSSAAVGDINNNGFQDLIFTGAIDLNGNSNVDTTHNEVYVNNNGQFSLLQHLGSSAVHLSDVEFIDFDNDGFLDMVTTGLSYNDIVNYKQYRFRNVGGRFTLLETLPGKIYGGLQVFDFNHDGKMDYALNGVNNTSLGFDHNIRLYTNTGNGFSETNNWMKGTQNGDFKIIDINNDMEMDLVIFGLENGDSGILKIYTNTNGTLHLSQQFSAVSDGKMSFADFNADGFLDFVISGQDENYELYLAVFMNDGNGNFTENIIENEGLDGANVEIGDLNNDGYYDFIIMGNDADYNGQTKVFIYQPNSNNFMNMPKTNLYNLGSSGDLKIFDFNNDNHLDILMNGFDWSHKDYLPFTKLFRNTATEANLKPNAPTILNSEVTEDKIIFSWSGATDDKTPAKALQYELSVGTESGKSDIAKYTVTTPKWYLNKVQLPPEIFWSVKSIDASKVHSDGSEEKFLNTTLSVNEIKTDATRIFPNPVKEVLHIESLEKVKSANVYNMAGQMMNVKFISEKTLDFSSLENGVYIVEILMENGSKITKRAIKNK